MDAHSSETFDLISDPSKPSKKAMLNCRLTLEHVVQNVVSNKAAVCWEKLNLSGKNI